MWVCLIWSWAAWNKRTHTIQKVIFSENINIIVYSEPKKFMASLTHSHLQIKITKLMHGKGNQVYKVFLLSTELTEP